MSTQPDAAALRTAVRPLLRREPANFIDGAWVTCASTDVIEVLDPATETLLTTVPDSLVDDVDAAVRAARAAQPGWAQLTPSGRARLLFQLAAAFEEHAEEFALLEAIDVGKPITAAREEVAGVLDGMRFFAGAGRTLMAPAGGDFLEATTSLMRREAVGVVAGITPWNYPILQTVAKVFPALAVGNTFVLKPAETTPLTAIRLAELSAGILPPGVLNIVFGNGARVGDALVRHPGTDLVSFTGSVNAGRAVGAAAAHGIKRSILELGGNAPVVVFEDADLSRLDAVVLAGLYNAGQECMAASRVVVHESIADAVVDGIVRRTRAVAVGDSLDAGTGLGPLNSAPQLARVEAKLAGRSERASVVTGGHRVDRPGFFLEPTVVVGVSQDEELVQEEIFGPVFTVQTFADEDEALAMANGTPYGLAASVFTGNVGRAMRMSAQLDFGTVWVNNHLVFAADLPVTGFGISGYGTENSSVGVLEFTRLKHVMLDQSL